MTPGEALEFATLIESSFEWPEDCRIIAVAGHPGDLQLMVNRPIRWIERCVHLCYWPSKRSVSVTVSQVVTETDWPGGTKTADFALATSLEEVAGLGDEWVPTWPR